MRRRADIVLDLVRGPDVLDLGCAGADAEGTSRPSLHKEIRNRYPSTWGIDASRQAVEALSELGWTNLHVADAQTFELGRLFDTVIAGEILEHVERPGDLLRQAVAHLKPGGQVIVTTPYVFGLHNFLYAAFRFPKTCSNPEHVQWYCPTTLAALVEREGMRCVKWQLTVDYKGDPNNNLVSIFYGLMRTLGRLIPIRLQATGILFVIEPRPSAGQARHNAPQHVTSAPAAGDPREVRRGL